jgi:putative resolvase
VRRHPPADGVPWFREGTLPVPAVRVDQRTVLASPDAPAGPAASSCGLDARVSWPGQKAGLDRQVARLTWRAAGAGGRVVLAGYRDRPGRMNTGLAGAALSAHGRRVVVPGDGEAGDDLVRDMVGVLTSFCARLDGRGPAGNRALRAAGCARRDAGPRAVFAENVGGRGHDAGVMTEEGA